MPLDVPKTMNATPPQMLAPPPCRLQDLAFLLAEGRPEPAPWRVLQERRLRHRGRLIVLQIVGSSHVVAVEDAGRHLTEALVDGRHLPAALRRLATPALTPGQAAGPAAPDYPAWQADATVLRLAPADMAARLAAFTARSGATQMIQRFPTPAGDAHTVLRYRRRRDSLDLETVHTYPEEGGWVQTRSVWRWPDT